MSFERYIESQQGNLAQIVRLAHFAELVPAADELYEQSVRCVPKDSPVRYGRCLLICHRAFLSASALIARALPDDAGCVTRRAVEAARVSRAIKHDPENEKKWLDYEKRLARWTARQKGERPPAGAPKLTYPESNPRLEWLGAQFGTLSDAAVHFTPEFVGSRDWRHDVGAETATVFLQYFETDQRVIERELVLLTGTHLHILDLLDECYDGRLAANAGWARARNELVRRGAAFSAGFAAPSGSE